MGHPRDGGCERAEYRAGSGADLRSGLGGGLSGGFSVQRLPHPGAGYPADLLRRGSVEFSWGFAPGIVKGSEKPHR